MVHSGSASPMKTTTSASPQLTVVPASGGTTNQDLKQTPAKLFPADLTSSSALTLPSTLTPTDSKPHVGSAVNAFSNSNPAAVLAPKQTTTPTQGLINGRTSGRKRTPKACDCCGPKSEGHHVRTLGRGRGRGRGKGRGRGDPGDLGGTPKRHGGQMTLIKNFDLTKEKGYDVKDDSYTEAKVTQSEASDDMPVPFTPHNGPVNNCVASEKGSVQSKEDVSGVCSVDGDEAGRGGGDRRDVNATVFGLSFRGAFMPRGQGKGEGKAITPPMEVNIQTKGSGTVVMSSRTGALAHAVLVQKQEQNQDSQMHHRDQNNPHSVNSPFGNGDTVNLSDSEGEADEDDVTVNEPANGLIFLSQQSVPASTLRTPLELDSEMQMDQILDGIDQVSLPVTLSNGNIREPTTSDHTLTPMEVETSPLATIPPPNYSPITVSSSQFCLALSDHRLYCQPGTWAKDEMDETDKNQAEEKSMDAETLRKDSLEQLTDAVHEFLEGFYVKYGSFTPLSESDILEHLKKNCNSALSNSGLDIKGEMTRYRAGLASAPIACFMVMYNKHTLSLEDLSTLEEQNWLNDQIINMYGELIMEATEHKVHFFNSFFHKQLVAKGYDGVKRWTKKVDLFSKWLVLIPIHLEIHWSLVTVTMATKTISYYDSQGIVFRHTTDNIMKYLLSEAREKKQAAFQKGWKITIIKGIPQQKNDSDCGVFVLEYCRRLSVKEPLLFSQDDMPRIRKRIYKELCDCRLND